MRALLVTSVCVGLLAGCVSRPGRNIEGDMPLFVSDAVRKSVSAPTKLRPPTYVIAVLENAQEIDRRGNLGLIETRVRQRITTGWHDDLILGATGIDIYRSKSGDDNARAKFRNTSLCGMVMLASEYALDSNFKGTRMLQAGAVFVPITVTESEQYRHRVRLSKFIGDPMKVCGPTPGGSFEYRTESERQVRSEGNVVSSNKQVTIDTMVTCRVGANPLPAKGLNAALPGDYLPVSCDHKANVENVERTRFAWLIDAGMYLPLEEVNWRETVKTGYGRIELRAP
ncbi:hypothetical protein ACSFA7_02740 [Variovorax sp. LT1R20]|uniref:hypothetical protein n=1 Tax=Variovorax sp. LT1R20 TaxID=3443729 RepID=UPI003F461A36